MDQGTYFVPLINSILIQIFIAKYAWTPLKSEKIHEGIIIANLFTVHKNSEPKSSFLNEELMGKPIRMSLNSKFYKMA